MAPAPDFSALASLTGTARTEFKRTVVKPFLQRLGGQDAATIARALAALLPPLTADERAEVLAAVLAKGEYHPFRDGLLPSDVQRAGFVLDAKSVTYRFSYKSRPDAASRQASAYRATGFLPGLVIVYQGRAKDHRVVFLPGLLRPNASVTLNRVVHRPEDWTWTKARPVGILVSQDGDDLATFFADPAHATAALTQMESAMATAARKFQTDPSMRKDLDEISQDTMALVLKTDIGQQALAAAKQEGRREALEEAIGSGIGQDTMALVLKTDIGQATIADAEARGIAIGEARGEARGELNARRQIFLTLCETMPEPEARRISGYTGP